MQDDANSGTDVLADVADVSTDEEGAEAIDASLEGGDVKVPTDPSEEVTLTSPSTEGTIGVALPFRDQADSAVAEAKGIVSYDNKNGTVTAPVVKKDGGVQITTIIHEADAPTRFDYDVSLPSGTRMVLDESGVVQVLDSAGAMQAGFAPAWARDATGRDVPTHYEVSGSSLVQVVDHDVPDVRYPVVADPFLGFNLLTGVYKNRAGGYKYGNGDQWSTKLSGWGLAVWTGGAGVLGPAGTPGAIAAGNSVVRTKGWEEFKSRGGPSSTTVYQQYQRHAVFGYAVWAAGFWWDFETARGTRSNWFTSPQRCNWA